MITYATEKDNAPIAIFEQENELKMNCVWVNDKVDKSVKLWSAGRSYGVTTPGYYKKLGIVQRATTEDEKVGIELEKKLEEKQ